MINLINAQPKEEFEYWGQASYEFESRQVRAEGVINQPITSTLFLRTGLTFLTEHGVYDNVVPSLNIDEPARPIDRFGGRVALRWLISEDTDATLFVDYEKEERNGLSQANFIRDNGGTGVFFPVLSMSDPFVRNQDTAGSQDTSIFNASLNVNHSLSFATLQSISNFRNVVVDQTSDVDGVFIGVPSTIAISGMGAAAAGSCEDTATELVNTMCEADSETETTVFSQEFRLVGTTEGPLQWLAGADYRQSRNPILNRQRNRNNTILADNYEGYTDLADTSVGLFGSLGYEIWNGLTIAGAGRYSYESRDFRQIVTSSDPAFLVMGMVVAPAQGVIQDTTDRALFQAFSPTVTLSYEWDDYLAYASWAQAFRSGGFNTGSGGTAGTFQETVPLAFQEEEANSYEIGLKGSFDTIGDGVDWSVAIYRVQYNNVLQNGLAVDTDAGAGGTLPSPVVLNVGDAWSHGVEVDFRGRINDILDSGGRLTYSGGITFNESKVTSVNSFADIDRKGLPLQNLPRWTWRGNFTYARPMPWLENTGLNFFANTNFSWQVGGVHGSGAKLDTRKVWNAQLGITGNDFGQTWRLTAYMDNIWDVQYDYRTNPIDLGMFGNYPGQPQFVNDPRSFGIRLRIAGGEG
ncbi:MAG: TonB-dependent receptor [Alphaproteobacteria bacterium]|nr:TonB-dependent receptor [Alphaproteobacteria bacterium]